MTNTRLQELKDLQENYISALTEIEDMKLSPEEKKQATHIVSNSIIHEHIALEQFE